MEFSAFARLSGVVTDELSTAFRGRGYRLVDVVWGPSQHEIAFRFQRAALGVELGYSWGVTLLTLYRAHEDREAQSDRVGFGPVLRYFGYPVPNAYGPDRSTIARILGHLDELQTLAESEGEWRILVAT